MNAHGHYTSCQDGRFFIPSCLAIMGLLAVGCSGEIDSSTRGSSTILDSGLPGHDAIGSTDPRDPSGSSSSSPLCRKRETPFKGHCYLATGMNWMDYQTAKAMCTNMGAAPVSITSAAENAFVYKMLFHMTSSAWIGIRRKGHGGGHVWDDGTALSYTNWDSGEPDSRDCGIMRGPRKDTASQGKWADTSCSSMYREIICKRSP